MTAPTFPTSGAGEFPGELTQAPAFFMVLAPDGTILAADDTATTLLPNDKQDIAGGSLFTWWPEHEAFLRERVAQAKNQGQLETFRLTGEKQSLRLSLYPVQAGEEVTHLLLFGQDITRQLQSDEQIRELAARLETKVFERTRELQQANLRLDTEKKRAELLAGFSWMLMGDTRDYRRYLQHISAEVALLIGEMFGIIVFTEDLFTFEVIAYAHQNPAKHKLFWQVIRQAPYPFENRAFTASLLQGQGFSASHISRAELEKLLHSSFWPLLEEDGLRALRFIPLNASGKPIGMLFVARHRQDADFSEDDIAFLDSLASPISLTIQNARLFEQVALGSDQLRAISNQIVQAQEAQLRNLAAELHDQVGQDLTAININLFLLGGMLSASCPPEAKTRLEETIKLVESTVEHMRGIMAEYRPPMLDAYGLTAALYWYAEQFTRRTGIHVQIEDRFMRQSRLPVGLEIGLFRIVQEAMTNTAKHAQASEISINLTQSNSELMLVVQDNGQGFEVEQAPTTSGHWGLVIMRERAAALGGTLRIEPGPLNGIKITARLPYEGKR